MGWSGEAYFPCQRKVEKRFEVLALIMQIFFCEKMNWIQDIDNIELRLIEMC